MKRYQLPILLFACLLAVSCSNKIYLSNGEKIYKTGQNRQGEKLLDKSASRITIVKSCKTCHGNKGDRMKHVSIKFSDLANSANDRTPYTDSLFFRFLDHDLKSNGSKANIGVVWKMNDQDKKDLLGYLKTL